MPKLKILVKRTLGPGVSFGPTVPRFATYRRDLLLPSPPTRGIGLLLRERDSTKTFDKLARFVFGEKESSSRLTLDYWAELYVLQENINEKDISIDVLEKLEFNLIENDT
jgi:hypothetical protein